MALFARYFGWTLNEILELTPSQLILFQESLYDILRQENGESSNGSKHSDAEIERSKVILEDRIKSIKEKGKTKVTLKELFC